MKVRTFLKTSVLALLVATAGFVSAQDATCFNLSADDCAYINTALANTETALGSSFQLDMTIDATVSGIPDSEDAEFHLVGSGPVVEAEGDIPVNFDFTVDLSGTDGTTPQTLSTAARLVDGIIYIQNPDDQTWIGLKTEDVMSQMESNPMVPSADSMADVTAAIEALGLDEADMTAAMALPGAEGFLDYSRDGEAFTFTADFGKLISSTEWTTFVTQVTPKLQQNPDTAQFAAVLPLLPMLLSEGTISVVQVVDPALNAVTEIKLLVNASMNAGMMSGDSSAAPITLDFAFDLKVSNVGGSFTIEAPADATMQEMPAGS